jgi:hypothetical protein
MTDSTTVTAPTNSTPKSCVDVTCDCNTMWSFAQQFSTVRLCVQTGKNKGKLVEDYGRRARRIAATYARFYLELEDGGNPEQKGRYYWMALGAFASKTVACTLESIQIRAMSQVIKTVWDGLGKGNFWLFCDISGWHWYYNNQPKTFWQCLENRDARKYSKEVRKQIEKLPWNQYSLPTIKYMQVSKEIKSGFKYIAMIESEKNLQKRQSLQLLHLLEIANHEQGVILQPLIYENQGFSSWIAAQRAPVINWFSPALELVFRSQCSIDDSKMKSVAPDDTTLENFESRMIWIGKTATKFHNLMRSNLSHMEQELNSMASWVESVDPATSAEQIIRVGSMGQSGY